MQILCLVLVLALCLPDVVTGDRTVIVERSFKEIIKEFDDIKHTDDGEIDERTDVRGIAQNCGHGDMTLSWNPTELNKRSSVNISLDMIAPVNFTGGAIKGSIYKGSWPVFSQTVKINCQWINFYFPGSCPAEKNAHIKASHTITDLSKLGRLPSVKYTFKAQITNTAGELFACAKALVSVR